MKSTFFKIKFFFALLALSICIESCQKSDIVNAQSNPTDIFEKIDYPTLGSQDEPDANMNVQLTKVHKAVLPFFKRKDVRDFVLLNARNSLDNVLSLEDLMHQFSEIELAVQNVFIGTNTGRVGNLDDLIAYVKSQMVYDNEEYEPVIHVPNISSVTNTADYVVAIGAEIAGQDDDAIPGWLEIENGEEPYTLVSITETEAMEAQFPVFIICNGEINNLGGKSTNELVKSSKDVLKTSSVVTDLLFPSMRIKGGCSYRYEQGTNKSDVRCAFRLTNDPNYGGSTSQHYATLAEFTSTQVCNGTTKAAGGLPVNGAGFSTNSTITDFYIDFFEYDWYATRKNLPSYLSSTNKGAMKYSNEWYCSSGTTAINMDNTFPSTGDEYEIESYKMVVTLKRQN
ncbi:MAG: hypothetical protein ACKVTZ_17250 [Bacteroidia bacterium]